MFGRASFPFWGTESRARPVSARAQRSPDPGAVQAFPLWGMAPSDPLHPPEDRLVDEPLVQQGVDDLLEEVLVDARPRRPRQDPVPGRALAIRVELADDPHDGLLEGLLLRVDRLRCPLDRLGLLALRGLELREQVPKGLREHRGVPAEVDL